jgi:hypothetical protein
MSRRICYEKMNGESAICLPMTKNGDTNIVDCHDCRVYQEHGEWLEKACRYTAWGGKSDIGTCEDCEWFSPSIGFYGSGYCMSDKFDGDFRSETSSCDCFVPKRVD